MQWFKEYLRRRRVRKIRQAFEDQAIANTRRRMAEQDAAREAVRGRRY